MKTMTVYAIISRILQHGKGEWILSKKLRILGMLGGLFFAFGAVLFIIYFWNLDRNMLTNAYHHVKNVFDSQTEIKGEIENG